MGDVKSKDHVVRLARLEAEFRTLPDDRFAELVGQLTDEEAMSALSSRSGGQDGAIDIQGLRDAMRRARMKGLPDQVAAAITEPCLDACIAALGDHADFPTLEQLTAVVPGLVATFGIPTTRLMFASAALQEAPAANHITKLLKADPTLAITPVK
jgi:hypothetical protein